MENTTTKNKHFDNTTEPFSFSWYLSFCAKHPSLTLQMVLSSIFVQLFAFGMPIFYMIIFDRVFGRQNLSTLDVIAVGMLLIMFFDLGIKNLRAFILSHYLEDLDRHSLKFYLDNITKLSLGKISPSESKKYADKISDLFSVNQSVSQMILINSLDAAFSLIMVFVLLALNVKLALISMAPLIPVGILIFRKTPRQKKLSAISTINRTKNQIKLSEYFENFETIKSINAENLILKNIYQVVNQGIEEEFNSKCEKLNAGSDLSFIMNLGSFAILYFGAHEVLSGNISFGVYLAISIMGRNFIGGIQKLLVSLQQFHEANISARELKKLITTEVSENKSQGIEISNFRGYISINNVSFGYNRELPTILRNINLTIEQGEKLVITGSSGSGKTTLVRLLQRLLVPIEGFIALDGVNMSEISPSFIKNKIGVIQQKPSMFAGTIKENLIMNDSSINMEDVLRACSFAHLDATLLKLPKGLDTNVMPMGANLSDSQKSQIAIVRTLVRKPDVLIIDDALNKFDFMLQEKIFTRLLNLFAQKTCIFISDNVQIHQAASKIVVLEEGQIVEYGTFNELVNNRGYYFHLHATQSIVRSEK